jgi:hypothetical protein
MATSATAKPAVEFFFDTSCPWSYLALDRVREAAIRTGSRVIYRLLVGDVPHAIPLSGGQTDPSPFGPGTEPGSDWARYCGLALRRPGRSCGRI